MDKSVFLYLLIEAIVFLIPVATLFIKIGGYKKTVEDVVEKMLSLFGKERILKAIGMTDRYTGYKAKEEVQALKGYF